MKRGLRVLLWIAASYALGCVAAGVMLCHWTLRLHRRPVGSVEEYRHRVGEQFGGEVRDVSVVAADGVVLRGWLVEPKQRNGQSVVILHGLTANRSDSVGFSEMFLNRGYSVLMPDSRDHGGSGGQIATYGVLEREDVRRWVAWLRTREPGCTYLLGESMGAAIGLEAAAVTPQLCAVAVESPYAGFREIAYDRLGGAKPTGAAFWKTIGRPVIEMAILDSWIEYRVWLPDASPEDAVRRSKVPALLIAGTADTDIPLHHAQELQAACSGQCELWVVEGAAHGGASTVAHADFERRVLGWFAHHGER